MLINVMIVILAVAAMLIAVTLFYSASADISLTPPKDWQASPENNSIKIIKSPVDNGTQISPDLPWKKYNSATLGLSWEYPADWNLNSTDNSMCDPITGSCFGIISLGESLNVDFKTYIEGLNLVERQNTTEGEEMIVPFKMSNYTIDGEPSAEGTRRLIVPETGGEAVQQEIQTIHNGKDYGIFYSGYPTELAKPELKQTLDKIIKSIKWE